MKRKTTWRKKARTKMSLRRANSKMSLIQATKLQLNKIQSNKKSRIKNQLKVFTKARKRQRKKTQ